MPQGRLRLLLPLATILSHLVTAPATTSVSNMPPLTSAPRSGCPSMCGDVSIPYPFGIGEGCAWPGADNFSVTCDHTYSPPTPYYYSVSKQSYEIINISVETGEMHIFSAFSYICFNSSNTTEAASGWQLNYTKSPFLVSPTRNQFTAIGGNTLAFMEGREDFSYYTGCVTSSITLEGAAGDGDDCTGLGCCQTMVAGSLSYVHMFWTNNLVRTPINNAWRYSPCGYAFLAEKGWYVPDYSIPSQNMSCVCIILVCLGHLFSYINKRLSLLLQVIVPCVTF